MIRFSSSLIKRLLRSGPAITFSIDSCSSVIADRLFVAPGSQDGGFVDQVFDIRAGKAGRLLGNRRIVDVLPNRLALDVDLQDLLASVHVRPIQDHAPVETAGAQQRRIENVGPVGRRDDDHVRVGIEAVHLDQDLVERLLALVVRAAQAGAAMATDRVDFVDEDDAGRIALGRARTDRARGDAPTPTNISTNSEPLIEKNGTFASPATARAISVLPVPGGPTSSTPLGMRAPSAVNLSGSLRNSTTSCNSCFASSTPATSANVTVGLSPENMRARDLPNDMAWLLPLCACRIRKKKSAPIKIKGKNPERIVRISPHWVGDS